MKNDTNKISHKALPTLKMCFIPLYAQNLALSGPSFRTLTYFARLQDDAHGQVDGSQ
jgi:hypothetical protein